MPVRLFIISDFLILLDGLSRLVNSYPQGFMLVDYSKSYELTFEKITRLNLDIIIIDIDSYSEQLLYLIESLNTVTSAKIILITRLENITLQDKAIMYGVRGIIHHNTTPELFLTAIKKVSQGGIWFNRATSERMLLELTRTNSKPLDNAAHKIATLTKREYEIIICIARCNGDSCKVIANQLHISQNTLRNHLSSIYEKLGVANRRGLLAFAMQYSLLE